LLEGGRVACWGDGSEGQLGDGTARDAARPVLVQGLFGPATALVAGAYHTCALLADGSVACWGENRFGQVGDGTRAQRPAAVAVAGLPAKARALAAGASFNCALLDDGSVACWGSNEMGELGVGTFAAPPVSGETPPPPPPPRRVEKLPGKATAIAAAGNHACSLLESGAVWCWGANEYGQLGDGTLEERDLPVEWQGRGAPLPRPELADAGAGPLDGLDVSYHSGRVDWRAAAAHGSRFALALATAGDDFRDPFFQCHWERMRQAGLLRGAYHFFVVADDPRAQARTFLSHVVFEPGDLAPVVDIEKVGPHPPKDLPERLAVFVDEVEASLGVKPIIYTGPAFWNAHFRGGGFGDYPLWLAQYGVEKPAVPAGWDRWILWQWRGNADLPDVAPVVDLDRLGAGVDLDKLLIPERPEAQAPPSNQASHQGPHEGKNGG
jgi:lysozyme